MKRVALALLVAAALAGCADDSMTSAEAARAANRACEGHGGVRHIADYYEFVVTCRDGLATAP